MDELLRFFRNYEIWIYLLLGLGLLTYFRKFLIAWYDLRGAIFGLEREAAQTRLTQATTVLILLIIIASAEFVLVSFVAPLRPGSNPLMTPTLDILATPTTTLIPASGYLPLATPANISTDTGCVPGEVEITSFENGAQISGEVIIEGSANIPGFGFYKLEIADPNDVDLVWRTIQAGRDPVKNNVLVEKWDTTTLKSGDYILRLVVTNSNGESQPDCQVFVRVNNE